MDYALQKFPFCFLFTPFFFFSFFLFSFFLFFFFSFFLFFFFSFFSPNFYCSKKSKDSLLTCRSLEFTEGAPCTAKRGTFAEFSSRSTPWGHPAGAPLARPCRSLEYIASAPCIARREPLANFECETVPRTGAPACENFRKVPRNFFFPQASRTVYAMKKKKETFFFPFPQRRPMPLSVFFFLRGTLPNFHPAPGAPRRGTPRPPLPLP